MADNVTNIDEAKGAEEDGFATREQFLGTTREYRALHAKGQEINGEKSALLKDAEENRNIDKQMFKMFQKFDAMDDDKLDRKWRILMHYAEIGGLNARMTADMFDPSKAAAE